MDKKSKIFFLVMTLIIIGSVGATYWRIMVKKDYVVEAQVDCDPEIENCFVWECDPDSTIEGEACTGDEEMDIWYYKLQRRNAENIPLCNPDEDEDCDPFFCEEDEEDCGEVLCDEETKIDQEVECSNPEEYLLNNLAEEDEEGMENEEGMEDEEGTEESDEEGDEDELEEQEMISEEEDTEKAIEENSNEDIVEIEVAE